MTWFTGVFSHAPLSASDELISFHLIRPFKVVPKSDGRPAVEVDNAGKRQQFVSSSLA
jgi:hypothetical protein